MERSRKDWLVYLDVTNFLDKEYEKFWSRPGYERITRLGVQWDFEAGYRYERICGTRYSSRVYAHT